MYYPAKGIDWDAVGLGTRPDTAFAREFGVAAQVVQTARRRRGIPRYRAPESVDLSQFDWESVGLGERPDRIIARGLGISRRSVCAERRKRGIAPFIGVVLTQEGEPCRSIYEAMYDAVLHDRGKSHEHEVRVPQLPYIADFRVGTEYVEVVGMATFSRYATKLKAKRRAYRAAGLDVRWLSARDVESAFSTCSVRLRFRADRVCVDCGTRTHDLVKGVCRGRCYMRRWHRDASTVKQCEECGSDVMVRDESQRFCSRECYWRSLELLWPPTDEILRAIAEKPVAQVARDLGVKPSTLYMRLRRQRLRGA